MHEELLTRLGRIDIYLFDQIARGRITPDMRILDAGCGPGRNVRYLAGCGAEVHGVDIDRQQVDRIRAMVAEVAPALPADNFIVGHLNDLPFPDHHFDAVVCSAVLHFSESESEFESMLAEMWRVLASEGVLFVRTASTIGIEGGVVHTHDRWHHLPDGSDRFLVDEAYLERMRTELEAELLDPIKTTNVQNMRAMTTWVLRKP